MGNGEDGGEALSLDGQAERTRPLALYVGEADEGDWSVDDGSVLVLEGGCRGLEVPVRPLWLGEELDLKGGIVEHAEFKGLEISNCRKLEGKIALLLLRKYERSSTADALMSAVGEGGGERDEAETGEEKEKEKEQVTKNAVEGMARAPGRSSGMELPDGEFDEMAIGRDEVTDMVNQALTEGRATAVIVCTDSQLIGDALQVGGDEEEDYRFPRPCVLCVGYGGWQLDQGAVVDIRSASSVSSCTTAPLHIILEL